MKVYLLIRLEPMNINVYSSYDLAEKAMSTLDYPRGLLHILEKEVDVA